jgi:hypothetical protein
MLTGSYLSKNNASIGSSALINKLFVHIGATVECVVYLERR